MESSEAAGAFSGKVGGVVPLYAKLERLPLGKKLFTQAVCYKAPYFKTISPLITELRAGYCEVLVKNRKQVQNHLGTVHAIAMANMCELSMGMAVESACPNGLRWIPKAMEIKYLKKAKTDLKAVCDLDDNQSHIDSASPDDTQIILPEVNIYRLVAYVTVP